MTGQYKKQDGNGFSLIEVVIAMMIGTIGLLALSGMLTRVMVNNTMSTDIAISTSLARQKIEQVKLTEYNYVVDQTEPNLDENGRTVSGGKYTRVTTVKDNEAAFNTKTVYVAVYFSPGAADSLKKCVITTIIYP